MDKSKIKDYIMEKLESLPKFDKLKFVYLFGSTVVGKRTKRSDIDICLYYDEEKKNLYDLLFEISGSFPERYNVQMFQLLPLHVKREVFKGDLLYAEDKDFVYDLARKTIRDYEDFEPRYRYILRGKAGMEARV